MQVSFNHFEKYAGVLEMHIPVVYTSPYTE